MSHVKRDGKCYDLNYIPKRGDGFEILGYIKIFSLTSISAFISLFLNRKIAIGVMVVGFILIGYQMYSYNRGVNLSPDVATEVQCPPPDFDYNQQARNINSCMDQKLRRICPDSTKPCPGSIDYSECDIYKKYNSYANA
jgi:hypothetical protein